MGDCVNEVFKIVARATVTIANQMSLSRQVHVSGIASVGPVDKETDCTNDPTAAVKQVFRFEAFPVNLASEDWQVEFQCLSLGVANGPYAGGGFKLAPEAKIDDGLVDVAGIGDFPKLERLIRLPQARAGKHLGLSQVHYRQVREVTISSPAKLVAHVDGEPYRLPREPFRVSVLPNALRVRVPV